MAVHISSRPRSDDARDLVEQLLSEQQLLTPVADFARKHDRHEFGPGHPTHRALLPLTPLVPGEQYAFEVELDRCSGCKACVTACHSLNGLDETETWRDVGLLISAPSKPWRETPAIQHTVTTACHHCVEPACLEGCPVLAYEKDPITGIVQHLDDQCIGCQYCVLKCPYDVPKYNSRLGIVRKCDMCSSRLTAGEAPACAQACPTEAIRITKVSKSEVTIHFREGGGEFLQDSPAGDYTLPTTRYLNASEVRLTAADASQVAPQPAHWPLVLMLVLTQASVGAVGAALFQTGPASETLLWISIATALLGLGASVFHLGRPMGAWRAFLNLKRSWMSREIVVFGLYFGLLAATSAAALLHWMPSEIRAGILLATMAGVAGVFCSAMIYADTRRDLWRRRRSVTLFLLTMILLGAAAWLVVAPTSPLPMLLLVITVPLKLGAEILVLRHGAAPVLTSLKKSALLVTRRFQPVAFGHLGGLAIGGIAMPVLLSTEGVPQAQWFAAGAFLILLLAELCERYLFFRCVVAPKMPGGVK